jgi:uncharacterized protein YjbJ (UPF0337 family)
MELLGKAQNVHGRNEAEFAKAQSHGLTEPEHFVKGTKASQHAQGTVEGEDSSSISSMKDRAVGAFKETVGSVSGNQKMELLGKAQSVHGRNEAEFAKAERSGQSEPQHFVSGTKTCDHADGSVVGEEASIFSALKDRAVGSVKETLGSATDDPKMELLGKAQSVHGRNQAEFAKAERDGLVEPQHFVTNTTENGQGSVESEDSTLSAFKDRFVGALKETVGSATHDPKMELIGKAQNVHGRNAAEFA